MADRYQRPPLPAPSPGASGSGWQGRKGTCTYHPVLRWAAHGAAAVTGAPAEPQMHRHSPGCGEQLLCQRELREELPAPPARHPSTVRKADLTLCGLQAPEAPRRQGLGAAPPPRRGRCSRRAAAGSAWPCTEAGRLPQSLGHRERRNSGQRCEVRELDKLPQTRGFPRHRNGFFRQPTARLPLTGARQRGCTPHLARGRLWFKLLLNWNLMPGSNCRAAPPVKDKQREIPGPAAAAAWLQIVVPSITYPVSDC